MKSHTLVSGGWHVRVTCFFDMIYKDIFVSRFMNQYNEKYREIIKKLINDSFPELKELKIYIRESSHEKFESISADVYYFGLFWRIRLSRRLRDFPKKYIIAILTHELCHISIFQKRNFFKKLFFFYFLLYLKKFRTKEERNTELLQIQKGYGKELYYTEQKNKPHLQRLKISGTFNSYELKFLRCGHSLRDCFFSSVSPNPMQTHTFKCG